MPIITLVKKLPNLTPDEEKIFAEEIAMAYLKGKRDAEPKDMKWINGKCSNCGREAEVSNIGFDCTGGMKINYKNTNFCPHCGAKNKRIYKVKISGARWKK